MAKPSPSKQSSTSTKKITRKKQGKSSRNPQPPRSPPKIYQDPQQLSQAINATPLSLTSFTKFTSLVPELRVRIWNMAMPKPSTKQFYIKFRRANNGDAVIRFHATSIQNVLGLQYACWESRHEVLKALPHRLLSIRRDCEYRFGDLDTICIINGHEMIDMYQYILQADANGMKLGGWASKVKTLRLSSRMMYWYNNTEYQAIARMMAEFCQLSQLKFVMAYRDHLDQFHFYENGLVELGSRHRAKNLLLDVDINAAVSKGIKEFGGCTRPCKQALRSVTKTINRTLLKLQLVSQFPRIPLTLLAPEDWTSEVKKYGNQETSYNGSRANCTV